MAAGLFAINMSLHIGRCSLRWASPQLARSGRQYLLRHLRFQGAASCVFSELQTKRCSAALGGRMGLQGYLA